MEIEFSKKVKNLFNKLDSRIQDNIIKTIEKFKKSEKID